MSFSSNIKEELSRNETGARHCKIAEIAGFLRFGGNISLEPEHYEIQIQTETVSAAKRFYKLIKDVFDIHAKIDVGRNEFLKRSATACRISSNVFSAIWLSPPRYSGHARRRSVSGGCRHTECLLRRSY